MPQGETNHTMTPQDIGLNDELTATLAEWNPFWGTHFSGYGWDSRVHEEKWRPEDESIAARLRREVA